MSGTAMWSNATIGRRSSSARCAAALAVLPSSPARARSRTTSPSSRSTIAPDAPGYTRTRRSTISDSTSSRSRVDVRTFETSKSADTSRSFRSDSRCNRPFSMIPATWFAIVCRKSISSRPNSRGCTVCTFITPMTSSRATTGTESIDVKRFSSMLSVPVVARDEVIGVMNVQTVQPREFGREEIDFLQTIANQVAGIIEKGRLQRESDRKLREVSALFEVSNVLTSTLDLDEVLSLVVDRLVRVYRGASGAILLREEGEDRERSRSGELQRTATQAAHRAIAERRPIVAFDHIAMPLIANDRLLGAVVLQVPDYKEFLDEEVRFVDALANQAALAIDKASLYALERKTTERLRELERARSDFVAVVTHDLRTPLSVIRGHLEMLGERNGASKLPISEATSQVLRLDQLVDRILAGVRTDRPELALRRTRFDLRATVTAALKEVAPMARRHKLTGPRAGQPVFVRGDRRRTAEVVAGLVHNATKYTPEGTRIAVKIERADDRAIVRVQDQGRGVPPNERSRIFEPYARGAGNDEVPGSGIGLFASRRVVEGQGGDIWVEASPDGGGAVFAFTVPL